ncbi:hypothetical protein NC652_011157 [Populus alba x Populus x berolinensis]|nr:hypothetical protein NC652_011157 [Populus alba x Populus x berolinensis]
MTGTSYWCSDESGHNDVAEGYSAEAGVAEACSAVIVVAEEIANEEEDCERAVSGGCVDREGMPVSGVHDGCKLRE